MSLQDFVTRAKLGVQHMVQKVGFFGILACASVSFSRDIINNLQEVAYNVPAVFRQL